MCSAGLKLFLIGPVGNGKSTTGNTLCENNSFTTGATIQRVTTTGEIGKGENGIFVLDTPGLGDAIKGIYDTVFFEDIMRNKRVALGQCPLDAFVMVIKFNKEEAPAFLMCAMSFVKVFKTKAIKSLVIFCIQGNDEARYNDDRFREILYASDGYRYLSSQIQNDIQYCLWDNYRPYPRQAQNFQACLSRLTKFSDGDMMHTFDMIENQIEILKLAEQNQKLKENDRNQKQESCNIL